MIEGLTLEVATHAQSIAALAPDYDQLCRAIGNRSPFALYGWHSTWCAHFLRSGGRLHDQPIFHVVRDQRGECVALVPLIWTRRRIGPFTVQSIELLGADPAITELRTPLILPGRELGVVRCIHENLLKLKGWDWIHWTNVTPELGAALDRVCNPTWYSETQDFMLDLPGSWPELRAGLKRNIRESLRHCYNSLQREGRKFELVVAREPAQIPPALERFVALHTQRANMPGVVPHANHFNSGLTKRFLTAVSDCLAAQDVIRVFELEVDGRVVASRIGFVVGDCLYLYYSGFDPAWARYSVMTTTMAEAIKYAISQGLKTVNLSPTRDTAKTRWGPRVVTLMNGYVQNDRMLSGLARKSYFAARFGDGTLIRLMKAVVNAHRDWH